MKKVSKILTDLGLKKKKYVLRGPDRRKRARRYERVSDTKNSPDYKGRVRKDRRKSDRRGK